ncbi:OmpA family protein [Spirosoma validum]|uniref:OmpA family protein n=1 Tax=Spirosoma validum TaxID=2771355 RepID=A0A927AYP7_9BACT|nr:OmpA family protein [Spirosoma validum]MBD2752218.1 OmpA family protein [Spirosoma validum]
MNWLVPLPVLFIIHWLFCGYETYAQSPRTQPLTVAVRLIDAETDTTVARAVVSVIDERTGQSIPTVADSLGFTFSALPGITLSIQASAPTYFVATTRIINLAIAQQVIMKLVRKKPSLLMIKAFAGTIRQPLSPATAVITSQVTGKSERIDLKNGRLAWRFTQPDQVTIQVSSPGYTSVSRQMTIDVPPTGNRYEFDAELEKITFSLTVRAVDAQTNEAVLGGRFALTGAIGTKPVVLLPTPRIGFSRAILPGKGAYQLVSTAAGYEDVTRSVVIDQEKSEVVVRLKAKALPANLIAAKTTVQVKPTMLTTNVASASAVTTKSFGVIERGKSIRLNKIYFDQSSPVLRTESYAELDQLYAVLMQYSSLRIEIRGYTDNQGDFDLNTQLARDRCQAVVDYLSKKGIGRNRLSAVGRGPLDPVAPNNNEENRKKNRRVEFVLL